MRLKLKEHVFGEYKKCQTSLKTFRNLWAVVVSYSKKRKSWWTGKVQNMDSAEMLESATEWDLVIQKSFKLSQIVKNEKPKALLKFIKAELDSIVEYIPVIVALRTRGLEKRHLRQMNEELDMHLDPASMTLADLKEKNLTSGMFFECIKAVADVASKENNIKMALDAIDKELLEICFNIGIYRETTVVIILTPEVTLQSFEDCLIRCQAMKGN